MKYKVFILFILLFCAKTYGKELTIGVPEWQGYTNADGSGVYFDLIRSVYAEDTLNIQIDSYNRTLAKFHDNKLDIVIGVFREDIKQGIFPHWFLDTEAPITAFYDPKKTQLTHLSDLEELTVSWLRGYKFNHFIPYVSTPYLVNTIATGFELLTKNRINVFIDYPYNVPVIHQKKLASLEVMPSRHIYIALQNNASGKKLAEQYDLKMPELRESGILANIFALDYERSELQSFDENKKKFIIKTDVTKQQAHSTVEPIEGKILDLLIDKNEHFTIELQVESQQSINKQVANNICFSNKIKTKEREKDFIFSKPMSIYMGLRLFSRLPLTVSGPVDITQLLQENADKKLTVTQGRSYTELLDNQLLRLHPSKIDYQLGNADSYLDAFNSNQNSLAIEFPSTISYSAKLPKKSALFSYPLKGANSYTLGHIMCKNTEENKQFIESINSTLTSLYHSEYFIDIFYSEADENSKKDFYKHYEASFKTN